jgi:hypothetical protein
MLRRSFLKLACPEFGLLLVFFWATVAIAGGFQLGVEMPDLTNPQLKDAAIVVRTYGCHTPADANVSGTAEGLVNGQRKSVPLELTPISKGVYKVKRQWPSEGRWVLVITGDYLGAASSALIELEPNGVVRTVGNGKDLSVRVFNRKLKTTEIELSVLKGA